MYYKFSAGALGTTFDLLYKSMTSEFQHLQDFTLVGKIYESGGVFNKGHVECFSDGNHWKFRSNPHVRMSMHTTVSNNTSQSGSFPEENLARLG